MLTRLGPMELLLLIGLALLVFGPSRLPNIARSAGQALKSFRSETEEITDVTKKITGKN